MAERIEPAAVATSAERWARRPWDLWVVLALLAALNIKFFASDTFLPQHDASQSFQHFYFFYNQLSFAHEPPLWMPTGPNSTPAHSRQVGLLSAPQSLALTVGALFGVEDV